MIRFKQKVKFLKLIFFVNVNLKEDMGDYPFFSVYSNQLKYN